MQPSNWRTTTIGVLVLLGAVLKVVIDYAHDGSLNQTDLTAAIFALSALGHILAGDAKNAQ